MTKYVVNSGGIRNSEDKGKSFFEEIVSGLGANPKILFSFFAEKREDWESKFNDYSKGFNELVDSRPEITLAMPDTFERQAEKSDAIYFHGGDDHLVQYWLQKFDLPDVFKGKVVATNSASSNALSRQFWTCDWRQCMDGLGILPIKFISHYMSDFGTDDPRGPINWKEAYKELEEYGDKSLPVHALEEGQFIVIEQ